MNKLYDMKYQILTLVFVLEVNLHAAGRSHRSLLPLVDISQKRGRSESVIPHPYHEHALVGDVSALDSFDLLVDRQRNLLLQQFCDVVGITKQSFYSECDEQKNIAEKYILRQHTGHIQNPILQHAMRKIWQRLGNSLVQVRLLDQAEPFDISRSIGVIGADICLYPPFFEKNVEQREADLEAAAMQVGSHDAYCVSAMHAIVLAQHQLSMQQSIEAQKFISVYSSLVGVWSKMCDVLNKKSQGNDDTSATSLLTSESSMPLVRQVSCVSSASSGSVVYCEQKERKKELK